MVQTIRFSEFNSGGTTEAGDVVAGLDSGLNTIFTTPPQFVVPFTTATRPTGVSGKIGYNTNTLVYEWYNGTTWLAIGSSQDLIAFIARLAAYTAGNGASLVGLQNQSGVTSKTVQDFANAKFIVQANNGSLQNAQAMGSLTTGIVKNTTSSGVQSISLPLTSIDGLSTSADLMLYTTGSNVYATTPLTSFARTLLDDTTAAAMRTTLGLGTAAVQNVGFFLQVANNLSDVNSASTSRTNLGLGTAAVKTATDNSKSLLGSPQGSFTVNHILIAGDTIGSYKDGGGPAGAGTVTQVDTGSGLTGGPITTTGTISFAPIVDDRILANISGGSAVPIENTISDILDSTLGSTQGDIIYRSTANWTVLTPGTSGYFLQTQGAGANPLWAISPGSGTVSAGSINQLAWYAANGSTVSGLATANNGLLVTSAGGVPSISTDIPTAVTIGSAYIYRVNGTDVASADGGTGASSLTAHGIVIAQGASAMTSSVLNSGQILIGSTGLDPVAAAMNSGSGILVANGAGSITVNLAAIADHTLLANISGGSLAPSSTTLTALIDNAIGSTQGNILYRNGTVWTVLAPGTSGQVLQTKGAAANPAYSTAVYPVTAGTSGNVLTSDGTNWISSPSTGTGTVNSGTANQLAYYITTGTAVSGLSSANNGLLVTSNSGVPSILSGPGTTGNILQSNAGSAPSFSTATYPSVATGTGTILRANGTNWVATTTTFADTYSISTILYASSANVVSGLATANSGILVTSSGGVPSISTDIPTAITIGSAYIYRVGGTDVALSDGGTNASLTASNGGIFYSTASAGAILSGTATAGLALLSGASTTPAWSASPPFTRINIQRVTTAGAGTYTPTTGMSYVIVQAQAAGGGGGGAATASAVQFAMGTGGGGGEYIEALFTTAQIGASKNYVVGAKGAGGTAGNNVGTTGGNTTFNTTFIATIGGAGGAGGASAAASQVFVAASGGGTGGSVTTGTLIKQVPGGNCTAGFAFVSQGITSLGGITANSSLAVGAGAITSTTLAGSAANANTGAGGSGAATYNTGTQQAGGNGADGFITFIEFVSI